MKIDLTQVPPSADDIEVERAYLELKKEQLKKKLRLTGFLHAIMIILGIIVGGKVASIFITVISSTPSSFFALPIGVIVFIAILIGFVFSSRYFITDPIITLDNTLYKSINELSKMIPSEHLEKLEKITKISAKNPVVKQYIQAALSQRDFLIKAEYSAIKSCQDQLRKEERAKKEQHIYAKLKEDAS